MKTASSTSSVDMATMPLTWRHIRIVIVASLGQLVGTGVATLAGVVIPMINILRHPELSSFMQGLVGAADLIGIVIGSVLFGRLTDRYGYITFFRLCPALVLAGSLAAIFLPDVGFLIAALFVTGIGIGGEYSLDSDYISELMPRKWRSLMIGVAKTGSAFGNIVVALLCWMLVDSWKDAARWPDLMWIVAAIAAVMLLSRIRFWQSPKWLMARGRRAEAERDIKRFLGPDVYLAPHSKAPEAAPSDKQAAAQPTSQAPESNGGFLNRNWRKVVLSGIPWACEGLGVYGIGVFLPILVMALGIEHQQPGELPIMHVANSVWVTFLISCIILPGFVFGLLLLRRGCRITSMQSVGFWLCAASLVTLLLAFSLHWPKWVSISAFMAFELFLNMGPHLVTYVLPSQIYPVADRGLGTGIAASLGKVGAVAGVFLIPLLLEAGGPVTVLAVSAAVMAIGAIVTQAFAPSVLPRQKS